MSELPQPKKPGRRAIRLVTNGNGWKKRQTKTLTCPSGQKVQVRRPGPEFILRAGKSAKTFSRYVNNAPQTENLEDDSLELFAKMPDEEFAAFVVFARELVCVMLVSPRLVRDPKPGSDEIGPDDIGDDFWYLFNYAMSGYFGLKVPVGNQEVEISDLESFRPESGVSGDSVDGPDVRSDPEQLVGDSRVVNSA